MGLTDGLTVGVFCVALVLITVGTAVLWNRIRLGLLRWPVRFGLLIGSQLAACAVVAVVVNDSGQFYTSWAELLGPAPAVRELPLVQTGVGGPLADQLAAGYRSHRSMIVTLPVPDAGRPTAHPALVYVPAAYFSSDFAGRRFPVIELLDGYPGSPRSWTGPLAFQQTADREIAHGRSVPFIAVLPEQNYLGTRDGECINAVHGPQVETTLTINVHTALTKALRAATDAQSWAVMGYSTGGFCATNIALRHPDMFATAVSLSGYAHPYIDGSTGTLFGGDASARALNDPLWRLNNLPPPAVNLLLTSTQEDPQPLHDALALAQAAQPPAQVQLLVLPRGGHNFKTISAMELAALDWIAGHIGAPLAPAVTVAGVQPTPAATPAPGSRQPTGPSQP
jgi:predicted esterase